MSALSCSCSSVFHFWSMIDLLCMRESSEHFCVWSGMCIYLWACVKCLTGEQLSLFFKKKLVKEIIDQSFSCSLQPAWPIQPGKGMRGEKIDRKKREPEHVRREQSKTIIINPPWSWKSIICLLFSLHSSSCPHLSLIFCGTATLILRKKTVSRASLLLKPSSWGAIKRC